MMIKEHMRLLRFRGQKEDLGMGHDMRRYRYILPTQSLSPYKIIKTRFSLEIFAWLQLDLAFLGGCLMIVVSDFINLSMEDKGHSRIST